MPEEKKVQKGLLARSSGLYRDETFMSFTDPVDSADADKSATRIVRLTLAEPNNNS